MEIKKMKVLSVVLLSSFMLTFSVAALGGVQDPNDPVTKQPVIYDLNSLLVVIDSISQWFQVIVLAIAVIMIIYAGFTWITSGGDEEKLGNARKTLIYALFGIAIVVLAYGLTALMRSYLT